MNLFQHDRPGIDMRGWRGIFYAACAIVVVASISLIVVYAILTAIGGGWAL